MVETIMKASDWPHGLRCAECSRIIVEGEALNERIEGFLDGIPILEITCMGCSEPHQANRIQP